MAVKIDRANEPITLGTANATIDVSGSPVTVTADGAQAVRNYERVGYDVALLNVDKDKKKGSYG